MTKLVGSKVYHHTYNFRDGTGSLQEDNNYCLNEYEVLLENERVIVISEGEYSSIKKFCAYGSQIVDKPNLVIDIGDKVWGNSINFSLYSTKDLSPESIKEMILGMTKKQIKTLGNVELDSLEVKVSEAVISEAVR